MQKCKRSLAISKRYPVSVLGKRLDEKDKKEIDNAIKKMVREYGEVLKLLGRN